jgi:single-stranded DNA-binding protein
MTDKGVLVQKIGTVVIGDPQTFTTRVGDVLKFKLSVRTGYAGDGEKYDPSDIYDVAIFNDGLRARAASEIYKGATGVVVEGFVTEREKDGRTYRDLVANRLGLVEFFAGTRKGQTVAAPVADDAFASV